jgi:hypothetical protein
MCSLSLGVNNIALLAACVAPSSKRTVIGKFVTMKQTIARGINHFARTL